jgi:hypothetical protein
VIWPSTKPVYTRLCKRKFVLMLNFKLHCRICVPIRITADSFRGERWDRVKDHAPLDVNKALKHKPKCFGNQKNDALRLLPSIHYISRRAWDGVGNTKTKGYVLDHLLSFVRGDGVARQFDHN